VSTVRKVSTIVPLSDEVIADAAAWERYWAATAEQREQWRAAAAQRRAVERATTPAVVLDADSLIAMLDRLGISRELATHMVQPYCMCSIGYDGLDLCPHARDMEVNG
jgi:cbb3-type cytochrome oxidase cytochrome c subunit